MARNLTGKEIEKKPTFGPDISPFGQIWAQAIIVFNFKVNFWPKLKKMVKNLILNLI